MTGRARAPLRRISWRLGALVCLIAASQRHLWFFKAKLDWKFAPAHGVFMACRNVRLNLASAP